MDFKSLFGSDYLEVEPSDSIAIKEFLDDEAKYLTPLKKVFLHNNHNEMFLVLDCSEINQQDLKECVNIWEHNILSFVNFGTQFIDHKSYLKFNTSLILQVSNKINDSIRYEIEKSKKICRKIMLELDQEKKLISNEKTMLPFYFEFDDALTSKEELIIEKELEKILPRDKAVMLALSASGELSDANYRIILEWIDENEK